MGMSSGRGPGQAMADINVTPLVDVMLVLLIIFMITAPLLTQGVEIDLPKADAQPLDVDDDDQLVLKLAEDGTFQIQDATFDRSELTARLPAIGAETPEQAIFLQADGDVRYALVAEVLAACKQAGFPRVGMVFDPAVGDAPTTEPGSDGQ